MSPLVELPLPGCPTAIAGSHLQRLGSNVSSPRVISIISDGHPTGVLSPRHLQVDENIVAYFGLSVGHKHLARTRARDVLRHGKATSLKIAGAIEGDKLLFSVKDNGCGFDPDLAPGIAQGHFGLQGVAERLERLNGEMTIDSAPGKGTKVTVTLWTVSRF